MIQSNKKFSIYVEARAAVPPNDTLDRTAGSHSLAAAGQRERSAKSRGDVVLVSCPAAWVMTGAFSCPGSNHCNRAVLGRDIASRTQCREETRHVLQYIDLANPQSSRRFR